jgi:hypothetical protein
MPGAPAPDAAREDTMPEQLDAPVRVSAPSALPATTMQLAVAGGYLAVLAFALFGILGSLWDAGADGMYTLAFGVKASENVRLLLIAGVCGALGSFIHAATSFAGYVGNQRVVSSWLCWYYFRPMIGGALAIVLYFVSRAGFVGGGEVNEYGVAAISGMTGMFSKQATDKLDEVFTTMFKTNTQTGDAQRSHKLHSDAPAIVSVSPATLPAGTTPAQIIITGTRLVQESIVRVNGSPRPATLDGSRLTVTLTEDDVRAAGTLSISVANPDGSSSAPVTIQIT